MSTSESVEQSAEQRLTSQSQSDRSKVSRIRKALVLLVVLSLIVTLVILARPRSTVLISAGIWLAMDVYWSIAALKRPKTKSAESPESRRRHGLLTAAAILLIFAPVPGLTGAFVPDTVTTALIGLGVQSAFTLFYLFARLYLGRLWSGAIRIMDDHELIQTGPYRFMRHPMYTGIFGMFIGTAIVVGQYHSLLGVFLAVVAYVRKIRIEDRVLAGEFGTAYETYRKRTAALVPWVL